MEKDNEKNRIDALYKYEVLDTLPDGVFEEITSLATKIFNVPICIVSLVDHDRIWFKSAHGIDADEIPRSPGLCSSAIMSDEIYIVEDARVDPRTASNPLVAGALGLQFYAAAPLRTPDGHNLGTLCIIDQKPRQILPHESSMLMQLARIVMDQFNVKLNSRVAIKEVMERYSKA